MLDTIKSYLISLGFDVDQKSYDDTKKTISETEKSLSDLASKSAKHFIAAGAAVASFLVAANVGIAKFVSSLAAADLQTEMLARQLWTSRENAESFDKTLKAMGITLEQLYLSPELAGRFRELRGSIEGMRPPAEFRNQLKFIRDIQFEFTRFKLSAQYAMQWVGHYLIKYLSEPLNNAKKQLQEFNERFIKDMPVLAERAGRTLAAFVNAGRHVLQFFGDMHKRIGDLIDEIPTNVKGVAGALGGIALLLRTGPFGMILGMLTLAILLIDDFYTHLEGGKSAFGPLWDKLLEFKDGLSETGGIDKLKGAFEGVGEAVSDVLSTAGKLLMTLTGTDSIEDAAARIAELSFDALIFALETVEGILQSIADILGFVDSIMKGETGKFLTGRGTAAKQDLVEEGKDVEDRGFFGNIWRGAKDLFNFKDMFTINGTASKRIDMGVGNLSKIFTDLLFPKDSQGTSPVGLTSSLGIDQMKRLNDETKSGNKTLDKIADGSRFLSNISTSMNNVAMLLAMNTNSDAYGYMYSYPQHSTASMNDIKLYQTNNVYGSDPRTTADAVVDKTATMTRNLRGWS